LVERLHGMQEVREFDPPRLHQKVQVSRVLHTGRRANATTGRTASERPHRGDRQAAPGDPLPAHERQQRPGHVKAHLGNDHIARTLSPATAPDPACKRDWARFLAFVNGDGSTMPRNSAAYCTRPLARVRQSAPGPVMRGGLAHFSNIPNLFHPHHTRAPLGAGRPPSQLSSLPHLPPLGQCGPGQRDIKGNR
jgi:hypothetical protein